MANIRDIIATGVRESSRFHVELHKLGVNIQCLRCWRRSGVDYEGTGFTVRLFGELWLA